jgi:hypothetical protein
MLTHTRQVLLQGRADEATRTKLFGQFDVMIARLLMGREKELADNVTTIAQAYTKFHTAAVAAGITIGPNKFAAANAPPVEPNLRRELPVMDEINQYTVTGELVSKNWTSILLEHGFEVGTEVVNKKNPRICAVIASISDKIELQCQSSERLAITYNTFVKEWSATAAEMFLLQQPRLVLPTSKAIIQLALAAVSTDIIGIACHKKPVRKVIATKPFKAGDLQLSPFTTSIAQHEAPPKGAYKIEGDFDGNWYLQAPSNTAMTSPFWLMGRCHEEYNMILVNRKVQVSFGDQCVSVTMPMLKNAKAVKANDELVMQAGDVKPSDEPANKKRKSK